MVSSWKDCTLRGTYSKLWKVIARLIPQVLEYACWSIDDGTVIHPYFWVESGNECADSIRISACKIEGFGRSIW